MTREIHDIPPAPRDVRLRAVLWHWWPVAFVGFVLGVYGGLITLMLVLAHGGKPADDLLLDQHGVVIDAVVTHIEGGEDGQPIRPRYKFTPAEGVECNGRAFLDDPELKVGATMQIEYVPDRPHINRPVGGTISKVPHLHRISLCFFLAGVACIAIWMFAVWRLRRLMKYGDIAVGEILTSEGIALVSPMMLRVTYAFRNHRAEERIASHWVRAHSALGTRLATSPRQIAVLHGRRGRGLSRLVMADDFVVELAHRDDERNRGDS